MVNLPKNIAFLVVDDSLSMRRIIKKAILDMGYVVVHEAKNGLEAWDMLQSTKVDFIVSDWNMPGMKGIDFLHKVRETEKFRELPFLMVSAESQPDNILMAIENGVSNYLTKPFNSEILRRKIETILRFKILGEC